MSERLSPMAEVVVCLGDQGIDNGGGIRRVRQARGLSNDDRCVGGGRGIDNAYEGSYIFWMSFLPYFWTRKILVPILDR